MRFFRNWEYLDKTPHCTCRAEAKSRSKAKAQEVKSTNKAKSKQVTDFGPNFMTHPVLVRMSRKVGLKFSKLFVMWVVGILWMLYGWNPAPTQSLTSTSGPVAGEQALKDELELLKAVAVVGEGTPSDFEPTVRG